jgi:hypothetical protein
MFALHPEDVVLAGNTLYVIVFTANHFFNGIRSDAVMACVDNIYPGGELYEHSGRADDGLFDRFFSEPWSARWADRRDLALELKWSPLDPADPNLADRTGQ